MAGNFSNFSYGLHHFFHLYLAGRNIDDQNCSTLMLPLHEVIMILMYKIGLKRSQISTIFNTTPKYASDVLSKEEYVCQELKEAFELIKYDRAGGYERFIWEIGNAPTSRWIFTV